jgi:hypothetical protein
MADVKPSDVYVGVIDLFSILLPGAALVAYAASIGPISGSIDRVPLLQGEAAKWVAFVLASYAVGHFVFLVAAYLDKPIYDRFRAWKWPDVDGNAYRRATELRHKMLGGADDLPMNTFSWAKCLLALSAPAALADVNRFEANSKFFRSMIVVLAIIALLSPLRGDWGLLIVCPLLAYLSFLRYADQRRKSNVWAYQYAITLCMSEKAGAAKRLSPGPARP